MRSPNQGWGFLVPAKVGVSSAPNQIGGGIVGLQADYFVIIGDDRPHQSLNYRISAEEHFVL